MMKKPKRKPPGPEPFVPTNQQRREVELAVATSMPLHMIADALDISRRTLSRSFARELAVGKAKRLLASLVRLDTMAEAGNVAACKFLHSLMMNDGDKPEEVADNRWEGLADRIRAAMTREANLPQNGEFRDLQ